MNTSTAFFTEHINTFTKFLNNKTKKELADIAKFHHIKGYSSLNKEELSAKLSKVLFHPDTIHDFFVYLGDDELNAFFHPAASCHPVLYQRFYRGGYCSKRKDGTFTVPSILKQCPIFTDSFRQEQYKKSFLLDCLYTAGYLYGCCPVSILLKMYNTHISAAADKQTLLRELSLIPAYHRTFLLDKDLVILSSLYEHGLYKQIQKCQGTLPFFIPQKETILHLSRYGFLPDDVSMKKLASALSQRNGIPISLASQAAGEIQAIFRQGGNIGDALDFLKNHPVYSGTYTAADKEIRPKTSGGAPQDVLSEKDNGFLAILNYVFSHTPLLLNRGYTAVQAMELKKKKIKIYPNTPCPCGSGKKYKNCCGRR